MTEHIPVPLEHVERAEIDVYGDSFRIAFQEQGKEDAWLTSSQWVDLGTVQ